MTVFYKIPESRSGPTPSLTSPVYKTFAEFKKIAAQVIKAVDAKNLPHSGCKWQQVDFLEVLVYGWLRGVSPHHAAEKITLFMGS